MNKRTKYFGKPKSSFGDHEYTYREAEELLGPCTRKTIEYGTWEEYYDNRTSTWHEDPKTRVVLERYDVWENENKIMILAQDFPKFHKI
ncbi:MAG: hypothetical protein E7019_04625 [Alphaproteobacteria bacterium]|nr:hypothetical protein [Alphaproteobacteria bacterium]